MAGATLRIVLADDHHIVRDGIKAIILKIPNVSIIGEAADGEEAYRLVHHLEPDILISDISMPRLGGIELTKRLSEENFPTRVLILSMHAEEEYINQSLEAGAWGYLLKDLRKEEMADAISHVSNGEKYYSRTVSQIVLESYLRRRSKKEVLKDIPEDELSPRELEILQLIADGYSNKEIANKLFLSPRTVDVHRYNIMQKRKVKNAAELIRNAMKEGLIR